MLHSFDLDIREHLNAYLAGQITLREFEDWFFPKVWNIEHINDPALAELVYEIKIRWAEFSHGDWTEQDLRGLLRPLSEKYRTNV